MTTNNNQQNARRFEPQYKGILTAVFNAKSAFSGAFAPIQSVDGITSNTKAFSVKTNATPVVIGTYSKDANVGFGTGTGNSSRFGNRTEVIYADTDVDFSYELAIHEGIDIATVNAGLNDAVADRLEAQSIAQTRYMNQKNGKFLSDNASKTLAMVDADSKYTEANINALFNAAAKEFTNNEIDADKTAYLVPDLYQAVVDLTNATSLKGATVSLDNNTVPKYKGFKLEETPDKYFVTGEVAYFAADQVAIPFVGIATARTIDVEAFDGKALQAHAKGGQFMLDDNKKAVLKATAPAPKP